MPTSTRIQERAAVMGNKASNLVELNELFHNVPAFIPLLDKMVQQHLDQYAPAWREQWKAFQAAQADAKNELTPQALAALGSLQELITKAFNEHTIQNEGLQNYLGAMQSEGVTACMVRSTGEEDTVDVANPGGNESIFNVETTPAAISSAIGRVVASYFSEKSLKQRLLSSQNNITESVFIPVMVQRMIGESPGNIIRSGVMYTHADMTCIQAAPGIGAVTDSKLPFDTFSVTGNNTIYSEIAQKSHRFVPQGQGLVLNNNPPALKNNAALPPHVVLRLADMGRRIEHHYGMPMDVEFVYEPQKDMIYLLQARPIPSGSVKQVIPSAIPPDKMALIKEEIKNNTVQAIKTLVVSTGGNAAKVIDKHEQVLICNTVQEALHLYLQQKDSPVQLVIVKEIPPGMSHHAAQLNANGIPVLQTNDLRTMRDWVTFKKWPLLVDVQRGLVLDWSKKMAPAPNAKQTLLEEGILKEGLFARPVRPLTAISPKAMRPGDDLPSLLQETHKKLIQAKTFSIQKEKAFTQLLDCIELIEAAKPEDDHTQALKALNTARKLFYGMAQFFHRKGESPTFFAPAMVACNDIEQCLQTAPLNYPHLLELTAKLSSLATHPGTAMIFSDSIQQTAQESKAIKKALALPGVKRLNPEQLSYFTQFLKFERLAVSPRVKQDWRRFILDCAQDTKKTQSLARMLEFYLQHHIESDWLQSSFSQAVNQHFSLKLLEDEFLETKQEIEALQLDVPKSRIHYWESQIQAWEDPKQFDALWATYEKDMHLLLTKLTSNMDLNPLSKKALFATILDLTEMMDRTIKSLKGSPEYAGKTNLQVQRFAKLLQPYHQLMQKLMSAIPDEQYKTWASKISEDQYNLKEPMLRAIEEKFARCHANLSPRQLNASGAISVDAVRVSSTASFARQFVQHDNITLEDLFTLAHQNILTSIQHLTAGVQLHPKDLPNVFQPFLHEIKKQQQKYELNNMQLLGIKNHYPFVELEYNIPLQNHSAKCFLKYNLLTDRIQYKFQVYGMNWANRMNVIATLAWVEGRILDGEVKQVAHYSPQTNSLEFVWELPAQQVQQSPSKLLDGIKQYCKMTEYSANFNSNAEDDLPRNTEKLFLRHPDVMKKIALFLRLSPEERKKAPWLERAFLWDFIVGLSEPGTQVACQQVLTHFMPSVFQDNQAIRDLLSLLPYKPNEAQESLKKRIITIVDYYLAQGISFDPFEYLIVKTIARYPELLPSYLNYLKQHQHKYAGQMSIENIEILIQDANQQAITELMQLGIIKLEQLNISQIKDNQLTTLMHHPLLKAHFLKQLYENSLHDQQPSIQSFTSYLRSSEYHESLLAELLADPLYKPYVKASFQTKSPSNRASTFEGALKKNYLELCLLFLQDPDLIKNISDNTWPAILEHDELRESIFNNPEFMLNSQYDNFFHEKLFTQLKRYLDATPMVITTNQLIKLMQWTDKEKQQVILDHPNLSWQKPSLEQKITMQIQEMKREEEEQEKRQQQLRRRGIGSPAKDPFAYMDLESKLGQLNKFWNNADKFSSDYTTRELFFKAGWIPQEEELSYVDYIKYQYDAAHEASLPRLSEAIQAGDSAAVDYYLSQKVPAFLRKNLVWYALQANQLALAKHLITQQTHPLNTSCGGELIYFAAKNGDVEFWQHFLTSGFFEKLYSHLYILESAPQSAGLSNIYGGGTYKDKQPSVMILEYLIEQNKKDVAMLILQSPQFNWPTSDKGQEKLISCVEKSGDDALIQLVLNKLNLTQEDRVLLAQSLEPVASPPPVEEKPAVVVDAAPVVKSIQLIQDIYQQQPKNEAATVALTKLKEMANQTCYQNVNCISKKDYHALKQSYRHYCNAEIISVVETELSTLREKIGGIDQHHFPEAQQHAKELLESLERYKTQYQTALQNAPHQAEVQIAGEQFRRDCQGAIDKARQVLERDLSWGDYLTNLAKTLANLVTLGQAHSFFAYKKAASLEVVEKIELGVRPKQM